MQWLCNGYATRAKKGFMYREWTDNGPTMHRHWTENASRKTASLKVESRKNVRLGGLKDELFMGPKLPKIKEN